MSDCTFILSRCMDAADDDRTFIDFLRKMRKRMAAMELDEAAFDSGWRFHAKRKDLFSYDEKAVDKQERFPEFVSQAVTTRSLMYLAEAAGISLSLTRTTWIRNGGVFFRLKKGTEIVHVADRQATGHEILDAQVGFMEAHPRMFKP